MTSQRLNGSKVLKGVTAFALLCPQERGDSPLLLCRAVAGAGINLPYVTLIRGESGQILHLAVEAQDEAPFASLLNEVPYGRITCRCPDCAILSLFPHQSNPRMPAALFAAFGRAGLTIQGLANSPSAISLVLRGTDLEPASRVLFDAFTFKTDRTPEEWRATQEGKEVLYKEVVASYQEQRPKVYGITCLSRQRRHTLLLDDPSHVAVSAVLIEAAEHGLRLGLITSAPSCRKGPLHLSYCLPESAGPMSHSAFGSSGPGALTAVFSMNGPHFGDRYGITSELLSAFDRNGIFLLALNCTVASVTGAVPDTQLEAALEAIQECFEVPTILRS